MIRVECTTHNCRAKATHKSYLSSRVFVPNRPKDLMTRDTAHNSPCEREARSPYAFTRRCSLKVRDVLAKSCRFCFCVL